MRDIDSNLSTAVHPLNKTLGEESQMEMDKTVRRSIPQSVRSFRASSNYDPNLPLLFACDASPVWISAVFSHVISDVTKRPIAFASRKLTKKEEKYAEIDKEALSIIWGSRSFMYICLGAHSPFIQIISH